MGMPRFLKSLKSKNTNNWFKERKRPFETARRIKTKTVFWTLITLGTLATGGILLWPVKEPEKDAHFAGVDEASSGQRNHSDDSNSPNSQTPAAGKPSYGIPTLSRNRNANQVVSRNQQNSTGTGMVPMGSTTEAILLNAVVSSNQATPVIAIVQGERASGDIPMGSRALGNASFDESSKRMQIRFHTFVYPDGEQRGIAASAMMPDGSSGLDGDYSSGEMKRQTGRFLGNFIGGLAQGLKERSQGGMLSGPFEPGSIRNGLLNGVAMSAEDQAHVYSDSMIGEHSSMTLQPGTRFLLYFEKEFNP